MNWSIKRQSILGVSAAGVLVGFVGIWGSFASLAGAVIASGQIEPESRSQVVQHPDGGTVARIRVKDGDHVAKGDVLLELDGGALRSQRTVVETQLTELIAEIARLKAEQQGEDDITFPDELRGRALAGAAIAGLMRRQETIFRARGTTLRETIRGLREQQRQKRSEITGLMARAEALNGQLILLEAELGQARSLQNKGLMQASHVFELERAAKGLTGDVAGSNASAAAAGSEVARLDVEVQRMTASWQEDVAGSLRDAENKYRELDVAERELARRIDLLNLRAPCAGIVHQLQIHAIGTVIRPADPVLYVVPQDEELTVTARIDGSHVDSVHAGQDATLRFTSFDARLTPELAGTVQRIAADATTDNRTGVSYYTADIALRAGELQKLAGKALLPGMPAEVYIQTGSRSPIRYILKPFLDFVARAGKE